MIPVRTRPGASPWRRQELGWLDWVSFGCLSLGILSLCVVRSRTRLFWQDELFSFSLLRDRNLTRTLHGWWEGSDSGGLLYDLLAWAWFRVFGASLLALRLLSTTLFLVGIGLIWGLARRFFAMPVVAVVISAVFLLPPYLVFQEGNGRFYGLFLASAAFASACTIAAAERQGRATRLLLVLTFCAHACLVGSHILGVVYSACLLAALVVSDLVSGRRSAALYGSVVLAWVAVLPISFHSIRSTTAIAHGVFWTVRPHFSQLVSGLFAYSPELAMMAEVLLVVMVVRDGWNPRAATGERAHRGRPRRPILVVVGGLLLAQLVLFAKSQTGVSIYSDRYLLPLSIVLVLLFCTALSQVLGWRLVGKMSRPVPALVVAAVALAGGLRYADRVDPYVSRYARPDYPRKVEGLLPAERVVVVTEAPVFMLMNLLDPAHHYVFVTDRADLAGVGADAEGQRLMENAKRGGITADQVLDVGEVLREYPDFTLLAGPDGPPSLRERLQRSGDFRMTEVGSVGGWQPVTIWQVRCAKPGTGCGAASAGQS